VIAPRATNQLNAKQRGLRAARVPGARLGAAGTQSPDQDLNL
jgi:hypothetical protein